MIRVALYFIVLAILAYGGVLLVQNPGHVTMTWHGEVIEAPAALLLLAVAVAAVILWGLFRFVFGLPSFLRVASRQRRREKGYAALSRGLIAVGSGDGRTAGHAANQADRHLRNDPLAIMLRAQAAHMTGDGHAASAAYEELAQRGDTRVLGLRGLHAEASRRGDQEAARHFAEEAHRAAPLPWSAQAVLEHRASDGDWEKALATVETSLAARLIDKATGERQRAVLETAIAYDKETVAPDAALQLSRSAMRRARDLAPPVVLAARLLSRRGDIRRASKLIEKAWSRVQHPDIAQAYLDVRPGDSTQDRLERAQRLMTISSFDPVSRMAVARAALGSKEFAVARDAMAPLVAEGKRPTVRQCMLMAELDEAEQGDTGLWREWLARASRAPLDPAWVADGVVYEHWAPASPTTGRLDAFQWQVPAERVGSAIEAMPPSQRSSENLPGSGAAVLIHREADPLPPKESDHEGPRKGASVDHDAEVVEVVQPAPAPATLHPPKVVPPSPATLPAAINSATPPALFHRRLAETEPSTPDIKAGSNGAAQDPVSGSSDDVSDAAGSLDATSADKGQIGGRPH